MNFLRILLALVPAYAAFYVLNALYNVFLHPLRKFPGPKLFAMSAIPIYCLRVRGRTAIVLQRMHVKYGTVVRIGPNELSHIDPRCLKDLYGPFPAGKPIFQRNPVQLGADPPGVQGIFRGDDTTHARQRRIFAPAFSDRGVKAQEAVFQKYTALLVARLREAANTKTDANMVKLYNLTTFDIMGELLFSESFGLLKDGEYLPWMESAFENIKFICLSQAARQFPILKPLFRLLVPTSVLRQRDFYNDFVKRMVDRRIALPHDEIKVEKPDIWSLTMSDGGAHMLNMDEMYINSSLFVTAATETSSALMSAFTWYLCKYPETLRKLQDEIRAFASAEDLLSFTKLQTLPYLNACLKEAMRVYPPAPNVMMRLVPTGGSVVAGEYLPGGVTVGFSHYSAYHSTLHFKNPSSFVPERWLPTSNEDGEGEGEENIYASDNKTVHQPFSVGPRNCLGVTMAHHEIRLIMASVIWHFNFELIDEDDNWADQRNFELWEKKPLPVRFTPV
ncbi:cytochrome P450 [Aspergillus cavernicola]|uniref:Cytochrome P450 n=1 Tax=Aspergillus cavernicola TaxID=176166 RepID=A0ABR4I671_9EURO